MRSITKRGKFVIAIIFLAIFSVVLLTSCGASGGSTGGGGNTPSFGFVKTNSGMKITGINVAKGNLAAFASDLANSQITHVIVNDDQCGWGSESSCAFAVTEGNSSLTLTTEQKTQLYSTYSSSTTELAVLTASSEIVYLNHEVGTPWKVISSEITSVVPSKSLDWSMGFHTVDVYESRLVLHVQNMPAGISNLFCGFFSYIKDVKNPHQVDGEVTKILGKFEQGFSEFTCTILGTNLDDVGVPFVVTGADLLIFQNATTAAVLGAVMHVPDATGWQSTELRGTRGFEVLRDDPYIGNHISYPTNQGTTVNVVFDRETEILTITLLKNNDGSYRLLNANGDKVSVQPSVSDGWWGQWNIIPEIGGNPLFGAIVDGVVKFETGLSSIGDISIHYSNEGQDPMTFYPVITGLKGNIYIDNVYDGKLRICNNATCCRGGMCSGW